MELVFGDVCTHYTAPFKNTIILVFVSCAIFSFGTFALQYVMTGGGQADLPKSLRF